MTRTTALNTGRDDFLRWVADERGLDLPARPVDAVLALLSLNGADRRSGVPEPTPPLVRRLLHEDLPVLLQVTPDELAALPDVLIALADRARSTHRLNAKRHARLLETVGHAVPDFERAMRDPRNLTWPRWYAALLTADGVDRDDSGAVREWLAALDRTPRGERPPLPGGVHRAHLADRTFAARTLLTEALLGAAARDARGVPTAGPLLTDPPRTAEEWEELADELLGRWTAEGLGAALAGPRSDLAPGPESLPHLALADRLLDEHLDYYGRSDAPLLPPSGLPAPGELRALLHAAPLPAALARGAEAPGLAGSAAAPDGAALRELAERCGFPGPAGGVWSEGTPEELAELAADILTATVERIAAEAAPADAYAPDASHLLYALYERGGMPDSVAREVADVAGWELDPKVVESPVPVPGAPVPGPYVLPAADRLGQLLGRVAPDESERSSLERPARSLAAVLDRLAATGCLFRSGDAYGLTPLGNAAVRHALLAGQVAAPLRDTVLGWDPDELIAAADSWSGPAAVAALADWVAGHGGGDDTWRILLAALSRIHTTHGEGPKSVFTLLKAAGMPSAPVREVLTDPVLGGYARRLLVSRGEEAPEAVVPYSARAVLLDEELMAHWLADLRARRAAEPAGPDDRSAPGALVTAFDTAAAGWPGGPQALLAALAAAGPHSFTIYTKDLAANHPDARVRRWATRVARQPGT
ncbi:hypothetical protein NX801_06805 [Streptomyces sp. LP05-1]|uniref:Helicase XPB/Ssl2 N-terminal domain-containing protein n=1 Tax=Streptomyces pyxinae TaxID=2970734 RepID=A0ABT2CDG4_9ACTN|nr:hypothetical protein [Streptomyces sp. LP05-1]MCS0635370.1 hypothetical protein [Streptomyces sp. LP05-1]